jgi:hypothetical protein
MRLISSCSGSASTRAENGRFRTRRPQSEDIQVYDAFGPQRLFWGSDLSRSPIPYRQHVTLVTEEILWLTADDKTWIMDAAFASGSDGRVRLRCVFTSQMREHAEQEHALPV